MLNGTRNSMDTLLAKCKKIDVDNTGEITHKDFREIMMFLFSASDQRDYISTITSKFGVNSNNNATVKINYK